MLGFAILFFLCLAGQLLGLWAIILAIRFAIAHRQTYGIAANFPLTVVIAAIGYLFGVRPHAFHQNAIGRAVRTFYYKERFADQSVNGLAQDLHESRSLRALGPWALQTLDRYHSGQLQTVGFPTFSLGTEKLSQRDLPEFIEGHWAKDPRAYPQEEPEVSILKQQGAPDAITIGWSDFGLLITPPNYQRLPYFYRADEIENGIYVYHMPDPGAPPPILETEEAGANAK